MPELPEVETIRRDLEAGVTGLTITRVVVRNHAVLEGVSARRFRDGLRGAVFAAVARHGKYLILTLNGRGHLLVHLRMTGQMLWVPDDKEEAPHTHLVFRFARSDCKLLFRDVRRFGRVIWLRETTPDEYFSRKKMGPDALSIPFSIFCANISKRNTPLKAALLNQTIIAGLGNIYVDEILFREKLSPRVPASVLSLRDLRGLLRRIRRVLRQAVRCRGTSISDYTDGNGRRGRFQEKLLAYQRTGAPCPRCGTRIVRIVVCGRGTHICPRCQQEGQPGKVIGSSIR